MVYKTMEPNYALMPFVVPLCPRTIVHYTVLGVYIELLLITIRITDENLAIQANLRLKN